MILLTIFLISLLQVALYLALDRTRFHQLKGLVLLLFILGYIVVMPKMFYPTLPVDVKCGLPILGIKLAFWILGGLSSVAAYLISTIVIKRKVKSAPTKS